MWTLVMSLEQAIKLLLFATILMAVQLIILTHAISQIRRLLIAVSHTVTALNLAVNPWAGEDEPTEPGYYHPPRIKRRARHISTWFAQLGTRATQHKNKRHPSE
jgi:hypothetical protein